MTGVRIQEDPFYTLLLVRNCVTLMRSSADGATAWNLGLWWDLSLPAAGLATIFFSIARPRRAQESGD